MTIIETLLGIFRQAEKDRVMTTTGLISLTTVMQCHLFDTNPPSMCCLVISSAIIGNCNDGSWHLEIVMYYSGEPTVI